MSGALSATLAVSGAPGVLAASIPSASGFSGASVSLLNDGTYTSTGNSAGNWVTPANATLAAFYQVKCDVTVGAVGGSATGSYLDLSTTRTWTVSDGGGTNEVTLTIREKATGLVRATYTGVTITDVA